MPSACSTSASSRCSGSICAWLLCSASRWAASIASCAFSVYLFKFIVFLQVRLKADTTETLCRWSPTSAVSGFSRIAIRLPNFFPQRASRVLRSARALPGSIGAEAPLRLWHTDRQIRWVCRRLASPCPLSGRPARSGYRAGHGAESAFRQVLALRPHRRAPPSSRERELWRASPAPSARTGCRASSECEGRDLRTWRRRLLALPRPRRARATLLPLRRESSHPRCGTDRRAVRAGAGWCPYTHLPVRGLRGARGRVLDVRLTRELPHGRHGRAFEAHR